MPEQPSRDSSRHEPRNALPEHRHIPLCQNSEQYRANAGPSVPHRPETPETSLPAFCKPEGRCWRQTAPQTHEKVVARSACNSDGESVCGDPPRATSTSPPAEASAEEKNPRLCRCDPIPPKAPADQTLAEMTSVFSPHRHERVSADSTVLARASLLQSSGSTPPAEPPSMTFQEASAACRRIGSPRKSD